MNCCFLGSLFDMHTCALEYSGSIHIANESGTVLHNQVVLYKQGWVRTC
jgi:hypothetical protein